MVHLVLAVFVHFLALVLAIEESTFDWFAVKPSEDLRYKPCYDGFKCARLSVPLDWTDPTSGAQAAIAVIILPAVVEPSDPSFGGTIITNPGGPGGSGVQFLKGFGQRAQRLVDSDHRHYEILSFDPRGVSFSTPSADCYDGDEFNRGVTQIRERSLGGFDEGLSVMHRRLAGAHGYGDLCNDSVRGFMSSASVARDMVEMVDKIEELRKKDTAAERGGTQRPLMNVVDKVARIQYFGFSYGTVLGNTFASMFPGRVGKMILDGVDDVYDYYTTDWAMNLVDTEKAVDYFYQSCFDATSAKCALRHDGDTSWEDIRHRIDTFITNLTTNPVSYLSSNSPYVITQHDVRLAMFRPVYSPLEKFPPLANTLASALAGNFTPLISALDLPRPESNCPLPGGKAPTDYTWYRDAQSAIGCGDGDEVTYETPASFVEYVKRLIADSPTFGNRWGEIRLPCTGWRIRPKWRYTGPFGAPGPDVEGKSEEEKTAAPLLFTSTRIDPVTPLRNAFAMSKLFPGSSVAIQEAVGHCSESSPSVCMKKIIAKYFETGEVPPSGTTCEADCQPWEDCASTLSNTGFHSRGDFPLGVL